MTEFLVRHWVKNYQNTEDAQVRTAYGVLSSVVGIFCNLLLFAAKGAIGLWTGSIAVTADAFNNLSDAASSIISFIGVKMAQKPADDDHPFGHGRIEYISAFIVAFLVLEVGVSLFKSSVGKILHPEMMSFQWLSIVILLLSVGVKLWLGLFNRKLGRRINSKVMLAAGGDALGDVAATLATMVSILAFGMFGVNVDGIVGLGVALVVLIAGLQIAKDTLAPLIGEAIDPELYRQLTNFVESFDGIIGTHDLIIHNYGPTKSMASIHAEMDDTLPAERSHEVIDRIEREAARRFGILLVIHMDPVELSDARLEQYRDLVRDVLAQMDERLSFHDLRIVCTHESVELIFDLVVPWDYKEIAREAIGANVAAKIAKKNPECRCAITVENSYLADEKN